MAISSSTCPSAEWIVGAMKNRVSKLHGLPTAIRLVPRPIRWEIAVTSAMQPQEAQQLFPDWPALRDDLLVTNQRLISYVGALETMIGRPSQAGCSRPSSTGATDATLSARRMTSQRMS